MTPADRALELIRDGDTVGLGTGRAAAAFIRALGERVKAGLKVRGVPTSQAAADLASQLGIPLASPEDVEAIDLDVDGADEVDPQLNLIKGRGGALVREKVVATAARRFVVVASPEKLVGRLGERGVLPVEVVPFARPFCRRRLEALGLKPEERRAGTDGEPFRTDNGNHILDCHVGPLDDPAGLEATLRALPGVVGTGLFLGLAHAVLVAEADGGVRVLERPTA